MFPAACYHYIGSYAKLCFLTSQSLSVNQVIKALLGTSKRNSWSEVVHSKLICIMTNMFYRSPELDGSTKATSRASNFLVEQVDLIGGVEFIFYKVLRIYTQFFLRNHVNRYFEPRLFPVRLRDSSC